MTVRAALTQLWRNGSLRRVATATTLTAVNLGALPVASVCAVVHTQQQRTQPTGPAALAGCPATHDHLLV